MWINKRELQRLERELSRAVKRAEDAEQRLTDERKQRDWLTLQLTNRVVTRHGGYGLEVEPKSSEPIAHPKGFVREPTDHDFTRLDYYKQCYRNAGKSEDEAERVWEAEMRGETVTYEYEQEHANES